MQSQYMSPQPPYPPGVYSGQLRHLPPQPGAVSNGPISNSGGPSPQMMHPSPASTASQLSAPMAKMNLEPSSQSPVPTDGSPVMHQSGFPQPRAHVANNSQNGFMAPNLGSLQKPGPHQTNGVQRMPYPPRGMIGAPAGICRPSAPPGSVGGIPSRVPGPPMSMSGPPNSMIGHSGIGEPVSSMGRLPVNMGGPPGTSGGTPGSIRGPIGNMGGPPVSMGGPPISMGGHPGSISGLTPNMGGLPGSIGGPQNSMGGQISGVGAPPGAMRGLPGSMGGPPGVMGQQPPNSIGATPGGMKGTSSIIPGPPNNFGSQPMRPLGPMNNMAGPADSMMGPPRPGMPPPSLGAAPPGPVALSGGPPDPHINGPLPPGGQYTNGPAAPPQAGMQARYPGTPMPGAGAGQIPSYPGQQPTHPMQPAQGRRLDPDQMPSPIQVMEEDQQNRSTTFFTNQKGQVPPLVTTNFQVQDQGNSGPRHIRSTMYSVPTTPDMLKQTAVPFGLSISPFARVREGENEPPVVDMGEIGPVRCIRCKAYMCSLMQFIDGGRRFHCVFCKATTEVPPEYFQHLDHTGQRMDKYQRPELCLGTYEYIATKEYCRNNVLPKPPAFVFCLDVSYNNVKSGLMHLLCRNMKTIIQNFPKESDQDRSSMKVGFITYSSTVHFYNVKSCLAQPQMMVVGDVHDMFMPLLDGFLCDVSESEAVIDSLMEQIPAMFGETRETETVLIPAIQAGLEALKAAECCGKLFVFHSSLPIADAPGKLKNRDDRKMLGTEKEKLVLAPQSSDYNNLGQECVASGVSVEMFIFNNAYIDLATIGQVARLTGGEIHKFTYFQAELDGPRFLTELTDTVSRSIGFDAIMRIRTSTGVRPVDFHGLFYMSNTTDMELAAVDSDKSVAVEIKHDDKLTEEDGVYIQAALLFTSVAGQRKLRILNLALNVCSQMADLYRNCELDTISNLFAKQALGKLLETNPRAVKDNLINRCAQMLACYRKNCANPSSAGQLILPECMKLLPLYANCVLKCDAVGGGSDLTIDERSHQMYSLSGMNVAHSVAYLYPRLLPLHDIDPNETDLPKSMRCSAEKLLDNGVYLLDNGIHMFLWIGLAVDPHWVEQVFGVHSPAQIDIDKTSLIQLDTPLSRRIHSIIDSVRRHRQRHLKLTVVRQRDKLEIVFRHFLVEDKGSDGSPSYVDFLCHLHKEIRALLN